MKNNMIIGAALFIISLSNSVAQNGAPANESVNRSFEKNFSGASSLTWTACDNKVSLAQFRYMDKAWLAYFNHTGKIIASGRKVNAHELPLDVNSGMLSTKDRIEKKYGAVAIGAIYEIATDGVTKYFVNLSNDKIYLLLAINTNGTVVIKKKGRPVESTKPAKNVLAKKN